MPKDLLTLPILGNPHGRIFQSLQLGEDPEKVLLQLLRRYGDILPRRDYAEHYASDGFLTEIYYKQEPRGHWVISRTSPVAEGLQKLPSCPTGDNDPTLR